MPALLAGFQGPPLPTPNSCQHFPRATCPRAGRFCCHCWQASPARSSSLHMLGHAGLRVSHLPEPSLLHRGQMPSHADTPESMGLSSLTSNLSNNGAHSHNQDKRSGSSAPLA